MRGQIFYSIIRVALKKRNTLPADTLQYIEALELIAKKALLLWVATKNSDEGAREKAAGALYEALQQVDFMKE